MLARWPAAEQNAMVAVPLHEELVARARGPLQLVFAAVALVLLIACVNVANLALVRATGRVHEFAVRATLGSGRARWRASSWSRTSLLAGLGGLVGLGLAGAGIRVLQRLGRDALPRLDEVGLDPTVLAVRRCVATGATAVAFGTLPALRLAGAAPVQSLRQQSRSATGGRGLARLRGALAAAQVALALTLLAGAAILARQLLPPAPGRPRRSASIARWRSKCTCRRRATTRRARADFQEELARRLEAIPGVTRGGRHLAPAGDRQLPPVEHAHPIGPLAGTPVDRQRLRAAAAGRRRRRASPRSGSRCSPAASSTPATTASAPLRAVVSANFARAAFPGLPLDGGRRPAHRGRRAARCRSSASSATSRSTSTARRP